ncbi:MAG: glycoside hydrolase family 5 protein, partial [Oscillospiraceae bacterium]|nr:glycoside hydrolase family 5 protein [Oscillospiraceae bacterium]
MKKKMLSRVTAILTASLLVTGFSTFPKQNALEAKASELTGKSATDITSLMKIGWNLGNSLDSHNNGNKTFPSPEGYATSWGNPAPSQELFNAVKEAGFNTVRIPTTWYEHIEYDNTSQMYIVNDEWMNYVQQTVDYAYDSGMFVILNVHHEDWVDVGQFTDETLATASKKLSDIWSQISETFADYDQHLIFEGLNEPRETGRGSSIEWGTGDDSSRTYINNLNAIFVNTIRNQGSSANAERLLMIPGYCASCYSDALNAVTIPENAGNIALSVHAYKPYDFTLNSSGNHTFTNTYQSELTTLFNDLKAVSNSKDVPIIIGEFSASNFNNTNERIAWANDYLTKAKEAGIPCVLWDNNKTPSNADTSDEVHGYFDRENKTLNADQKDVIEAMMNVYSDFVEPTETTTTTTTSTTTTTTSTSTTTTSSTTSTSETTTSSTTSETTSTSKTTTSSTTSETTSTSKTTTSSTTSETTSTSKTTTSSTTSETTS